MIKNSAKTHIKKKIYSCVKSKLKLSTAIPLLNDNNIHKAITSDFEVASLFNRRFQKVSKKDDYHQSFKLAQKKNCSIMQSFFITYEDIENSIQPKN